MASEQPGVHRVHGVLLWTILVAVLIGAGGFGLLVGVAFAKPPPDPVVRATPGRPAASPGSQVTVSSFSVRPPIGWKQTEKKDTSVEFVGPGDAGIVFMQSDRHQPAEPAAQIVTEVTAATGRKYPDVRTCLVPVPLTVGGTNGSAFALCYTFIPQGGRAYPATDLFWVATNRDGSVFYLYEVFAPAYSFNDFAQMADDLIQTVSWKLS